MDTMEPLNLREEIKDKDIKLKLDLYLQINLYSHENECGYLKNLADHIQKQI